MEFDVIPPLDTLPTSPPSPTLQFTQDNLPTGSNDQEDGDIFRGQPPPRSPSPAVSIASSSSSTNSSLFGGRFTAIAAVVETAISRWARNTDGSSSSSDSSSDRSSIVTLSRRRLANRKRRQSTTSLNSKVSEKDLAAKFRAREQSRHVPREFVLYLPPLSQTPGASGKSRMANTNNTQRVSRTTSLLMILGQLETTLRKSNKTRRPHRSRPQSPERTQPSPPPEPVALIHDYMLPQPLRVPSRPASFTDLNALKAPRKGKEKERVSRPGLPRTLTSVERSELRAEIDNRRPKAWWLDVSSPTWEDMRAIGKLLHLHPLTLEDILQQDPREKLELFPKLGYYFVSFRAIESQATRERLRRYNASDGDQNEYRDDGGVVGEVNIYLVVFREGVCSFHFTDIAEHTDRVRNRVTLLEETVDMSSEWIAHGILDSVVDSFFPFLEEVEKEVSEIEDIVFSSDPGSHPAKKTAILPSVPNPPADAEADEKTITPPQKDSVDEKFPLPLDPRISVRTRFSLPRPTLLLFFRRLKRALTSIRISVTVTVEHTTAANPTYITLRRMARTRRLVTSLARLLATKSEVVAQIRKRLLSSNPSGLGNGAGKDDDTEVAIHMGDVQDHILTLQHSLAHYERMLSQSHPTYLSQLRVSVATTKSGADKAIMMLSVISIGVLCNQALIGMVSMNVNIPKNIQEPYGKLNAFGVVVALVFVITGFFLYTVRHWWLRAKRRRGAML